MKIGYARVSTKHQGESLNQQIKLLKKSGCTEVYSEVISGAKSKRLDQYSKQFTRKIYKFLQHQRTNGYKYR